jgi:hypothetical protein
MDWFVAVRLTLNHVNVQAMGKGSKQRPTDLKRFVQNWDKIFKPKQGKTKKSK